MSSLTEMDTVQASEKVHSLLTLQTRSTVTCDSPQPAISVESVDLAQKHILLYLGSAQLHDLRLRISETVFDSKPVHSILRTILQQRRKITYDRETSVLRVYAMARPVHDAISHLVSNFKVDAFKTGFTTPEESESIVCGNTSVLLARSKFHESRKTKKLQAWTKFPDAAILFVDPESGQLPSVVFEVGFTESYADLVSDAAQWLEKSGGDVRLVVLVNVEEDIQSRKASQKSKESQRRTLELLSKFGNNKAKGQEEGSDVETDAESDAEMYKSIKSTIVVEDWIGPIKTTLEVWHMINGSPRLRQPPIVRTHHYILTFFTDLYRLFCRNRSPHRTQASILPTSSRKKVELGSKALTNLERWS